MRRMDVASGAVAEFCSDGASTTRIASKLVPECIHRSVIDTTVLANCDGEAAKRCRRNKHFFIPSFCTAPQSSTSVHHSRSVSSLTEG